MTLEEAKKIGEIVRTADGGCSDCVEGLCEKLNEAFPEFVWFLKDEKEGNPFFLKVEVKQK